MLKEELAEKIKSYRQQYDSYNEKTPLNIWLYNQFQRVYDFKNNDFTQLNFTNVNLTSVDFTNSKLKHTVFDYSRVEMANFSKANLKYTSFFDAKGLSREQLMQARNLKGAHAQGDPNNDQIIKESQMELQKNKLLLLALAQYVSGQMHFASDQVAKETIIKMGRHSSLTFSGSINSALVAQGGSLSNSSVSNVHSVGVSVQINGPATISTSRPT